MHNRPQQNPKFVYDGKRIQPVYERKFTDYSSALLYEEYENYMPTIDSAVNKHLDLSSQILNMKPISLCTPKEAAPTQFAQMCINKIRSPVNAVCWAPDGRRVLSGLNSGEITMWNGFTFNFDTILQAHFYPVKAMTWSNSMSLLATSDSKGIVKYWNNSMNNLQEAEIHGEAIKDLSFSYNDSKFVTASDDATLKIVDTYTTEVERTLSGHNWDVRKAQFHRRMALVASGGKDNLIKLWDPRSEQCLATYHYHKNTILSLKFMKDNYLISGGKDQVVKMMDLRMMKECFTYKSTGDITSLGCTDKLIFSGNSLGEITYWEMFNQEIVATSDKNHENTIWAVDMHPAGHCLASGGADYQVRFWLRPRPGQNAEADEEEEHENEAMFIPGL
ncbi:hypothetical protein NUSPORA_00298 [Nucleospora cyclopteri]